MKITVTQEDIKQGVAGSPWDCPVGRAVYRATGQRFGVDDVSIDGDLRQPSFKTPKAVANFIHKFDRKELVKPFTFSLPVKNK
jgi:hypothetical protein